MTWLMPRAATWWLVMGFYEVFILPVTDVLTFGQFGTSIAGRYESFN